MLRHHSLHRFEYTGRNLLLVRSSDAVVMVGGRIGTLNEMTIAIEERKPLGVLLGSGGMTEEVEHVLKALSVLAPALSLATIRPNSWTPSSTSSKPKTAAARFNQRAVA
jgi:predicted Rossmann-fold nucleotide-binding protein